MIGQERIFSELSLLLPEVLNGRNVNMLLVAPSGHGKTTLAYSILNFLGIQNSQVSLPPSFTFDSEKRFHFLDEIQELRNPEPLYRLMDSGEFTIILATNELGQLKEPIINRCIPVIFEPYTEIQIIQMVSEGLLEFNLPQEIIVSIASRCFSNPRVVSNICMRLSYVFKTYMPNTVEELDHIMENILSIYKNGLTPLELKYLQYLEQVGGKASVNLLSYGLHMTKETLLRDIEPHLIHLNKINITPRGRVLVTN